MKNIAHICLMVIALTTVSQFAFSQKRIVGYYPSWMRTVLPANQLKYENLTHIVVAFAWPEANGNISKYNDLLYPELVSRAHNADKKVLVALGGWGQSSGFSPMTADSAVRKHFIENLITFCDGNGFDGVDIDWEYPSTSADRSNLNCLLKELRQAFTDQQKDWLISMAIPTGDWAGQWFDYETLKNYVDWFGYMTYDFMGSWVSVATHNAPLYSHPQNPQGSVHSSLQYLIETRKISKSQILLGIPFYGRGCNAAGLFRPNTGGNVEYYYSQIIPKIGNGWNYFWDDTSKAPYLMNVASTQFITFDDSNSVRLKCEYVKTQGLGGVMIWALGHDKIGAEQTLLETVGRNLNADVGIRRVQDASHDSGALLNCYPNPFNDRTIFQYFLPHDDHIRLEIFDVAGRTIDIVLNRKESGGWHVVQFDSQTIPAGLYFYRLSGVTFSRTAKMMNVK